MAGEMDSIEKRVRRLEELTQKLQRENESLKHKLGQVSEDFPRQVQEDSAGRIIFRMQSVGAISASSGATLGIGTARFLQVIEGVRYLTQPFAAGDVTAMIRNDIGDSTVNNEYLICAYVQGVLTALTGDCATASPTRAPDPPA